MSKRGFTLIELLVVMGIMGLLGTISVGGYRAMQRGMEERGVMQNVNSLVRTAYQRAQIDRQPVAVYFWNEMIRDETDDQHEIVVGKAVAIRRYGRFSDVRQGMLIDEFADLNLTYQAQTDDENGGGVHKGSSFYIYPMEDLGVIENSSALKRTTVEGKVRSAPDSVVFLSGAKSDNTTDEQIPAWGFVISSEDKGGVQWKPGMAYGMEFMQVELPHNYIFGTDRPTSIESPVKEAGTLVFDVGVNSGGGLTKGGTTGRNSITVSSLRPNGASLKVQAVGQSEDPEKDL